MSTSEPISTKGETLPWELNPNRVHAAPLKYLQEGIGNTYTEECDTRGNVMRQERNPCPDKELLKHHSITKTFSHTELSRKQLST